MATRSESRSNPISGDEMTDEQERIEKMTDHAKRSRRNDLLKEMSEVDWDILTNPTS